MRTGAGGGGGWVAAGSLLGLLAVLMGAFAAHALRDQLPDDRRIAFEVGARYQKYHALAMILVGLLERAPSAPRRLSLAGAFFFLGIVLFSGSLYALALSGVTTLGAITPFGGASFLAGWAVLAVIFLFEHPQ